ncbi:MAG TPA: hypothetical protein VGM67_03985 [Gemmatimonadaceae bacterium]|jgi:hypothetical protein
MPNVFSGVLEIDTRFTHNVQAAAGIQAKIAYLQQSLQDAVQGFTQLNNGVAPSLAAGDIMIFSAPEYFFAYPQFDVPARSVFAYDLIEAGQADAGCIQASNLYDEIVIVPGTTLYKNAITRTQRGQLHAHLQAGKTNFVAGPLRAQITTVQGQIKPKGLGLKSMFRTRLRAIGYNQVRVYFAGHRIYTANKIDNAQEFVNEPGGPPILVPGTETGSFDYPPDTNIKLGVEVCADQGRLEAANEVVDIVILVSAAISMNNGYQPVHIDGLAIHANATNYQRDPSGMRRIKAPDQQGFVFDRARVTAKLQQAVTVNEVRCQMKTL